MALCPNCRVELGNTARHCPLCHAAILAEAAPPTPQQSYPEHIMDPEDRFELTPQEKRKVFLELFTICALIALAVVTAVNLLVDRRLSWSLYALASIGLVWVLVCIPLILKSRPWLILAVLGPSALIFLFLIDQFDGQPGWFLPLGLPITLMIAAGVVACSVLAASSRRRGVNLIAIILVAAALVCGGIELALDSYAMRGASLSWSGIVLIAALPLAAFLFYMHYRIVNRASLRKLFHL